MMTWDDPGRGVALGRQVSPARDKFQERLTVESYLLAPCSVGRRRDVGSTASCPVQPLSEQDKILEYPGPWPLSDGLTLTVPW